MALLKFPFSVVEVPLRHSQSGTSALSKFPFSMVEVTFRVSLVAFSTVRLTSCAQFVGLCAQQLSGYVRSSSPPFKGRGRGGVSDFPLRNTVTDPTPSPSPTLREGNSAAPFFRGGINVRACMHLYI